MFKKGRTISSLLIILTLLSGLSAATTTTPPKSITSLKNVSYAQTYINWKWTDPTDKDFAKVMIYIDGNYVTSVNKGIRHYNAIGFAPNTRHQIGTHTVDTTGNINKAWKNSTAVTADVHSIGQKILQPPGNSAGTIRFITIGDTHMVSDKNAVQDQRVIKAVNYINARNDVDFVVEMGDVVDSGSDANYVTAKSILSKLNKPLYLVNGNHDFYGPDNGANFNRYFGTPEHLNNINGYQLIFVGMKGGGGTFKWSFDFNSADKNKPTIIFNHGPVQPAINKPTCGSSWGDSVHKYACGMITETDKFTDLLGFYDGHVHLETIQTIKNTLYVSQDNLGGRGPASDYIGYTVVNGGNIISYTQVKY